MIDNSRDIELIEMYLDKALNKEEASDVESRLDKDSEFAKLFRFRQNIQELYTEASILEQNRTLVKSSIKSHRNKRKLIIRISAAASILLIISLWIYPRINQTPLSGNHPILYSNNHDSLDTPAGQTQYYQPEGKAGCYQAPPSFSVSDTIKLSIHKTDLTSTNNNSFILVKLPDNDTILTDVLKKDQSSVVINPHVLPAGTYKWFIANDEQGNFTVQ